ncbi:hypothetical protein HHI36_005841 [Cryptolaemus montrouzieri]|uniref:Uncharacterized protein n=1 Tax=Cryptolaemus montrouzieri TaxID=559131 RepID=A0ABD2NV96_9CUCU
MMEELVGTARKRYKLQTSQCRNKNEDLPSSKKAVLQRWLEHFQGILGSGQPTTGDEEKSRAEGNHEEGDQLELPTLQEVREAIIKNLPNKKRQPSFRCIQIWRRGTDSVSAQADTENLEEERTAR